MESSRDDFVIAIRSAFLKKGTKQRFSLLGLITFSIIFLFLSNFNIKLIDYLKTGIKEIVYTASFIASTPENFIKYSYLNVQSHFKIYEENEKDKLELEKLRTKNLSNQIITLENIKYKKLIDDYFIRDNEAYAKVLIDKQSPYLRSIILNKGSKNNIKLGMVILDEDYLIGKVIEVNYFTSRVLLISDINSKIPVSLEPGDIQAIMSGNGEKTGILQYKKESSLLKDTEDLLVLTSGAGGVFKSGIPIGIIKKENTTTEKNDNQIVDFYRDFSQLKYVRIVSYLKEMDALDLSSKRSAEEEVSKIEESNLQQETLRILLEQKVIADETRLKFGKENIYLKDKIILLENEMSAVKKTIQEDKLRKQEILFLELNAIYSRRCKKNIFNKLYLEGSKDYKKCILNKGIIKKS